MLIKSSRLHKVRVQFQSQFMGHALTVICFLKCQQMKSLQPRSHQTSDMLPSWVRVHGCGFRMNWVGLIRKRGNWERQPNGERTCTCSHRRWWNFGPIPSRWAPRWEIFSKVLIRFALTWSRAQAGRTKAKGFTHCMCLSCHRGKGWKSWRRRRFESKSRRSEWDWLIWKKPNTRSKSRRRSLKKPRLSSIIKPTESKDYMLVLLMHYSAIWTLKCTFSHNK